MPQIPTVPPKSPRSGVTFHFHHIIKKIIQSKFQDATLKVNTVTVHISDTCNSETLLPFQHWTGNTFTIPTLDLSGIWIVTVYDYFYLKGGIGI